jgi:hypothetical protein
MDRNLVSIALVITFAFLLRLLMDRMDRARITGYLTEHGGSVREITWTPFGTGWFGDKDRIYEVTYADAQGVVHQATCKTGLFSGVYFTEDRTGSRAAMPLDTTRTTREVAALQRENDRLRQEIERLRRRPS